MPIGARQVTYENVGHMHILFESVTGTVYSSCILPYHNYRDFSAEARNLDFTTKCLGFKCWLNLKS